MASLLPALPSMGIGRWFVSATAVRLRQRVSGNSNLLPGMSHRIDEHRIGYFGDWAESGCRGPSILITAFPEDAQESLKVAGQPHTTRRTNDLVSAPWHRVNEVDFRFCYSDRTWTEDRAPVGTDPS